MTEIEKLLKTVEKLENHLGEDRMHVHDELVAAHNEIANIPKMEKAGITVEVMTPLMAELDYLLSSMQNSIVLVSNYRKSLDEIIKKHKIKD